MTVDICAVVPSLLNVFLCYFILECSKKAGAGSNGGGEYGTSTKNCQNRQSRADRGLIKWCALQDITAERLLHTKKCTLTDAGYEYVCKPRP